MVFAPEVWRDDGGRAALVAVRCVACETAYLPHVDLCPACLGTELVEVADTSGRLHSYTTVHVMPAGFPQPLTMGYVDLPSGARAFGHFGPGITASDLVPDMTVQFELAELFTAADGEAVTAYRFLPTGGRDA